MQEWIEKVGRYIVTPEAVYPTTIIIMMEYRIARDSMLFIYEVIKHFRRHLTLIPEVKDDWIIFTHGFKVDLKHYFLKNPHLKIKNYFFNVIEQYFEFHSQVQDITLESRQPVNNAQLNN